MKHNKNKNGKPSARTHFMRPFYGRYMHFVIALVLGLVFFPVSVQACSYELDRKVMKQGISERKEMKKALRRMKNNADSVFVGRVNSVEGSNVTFKSTENIKGNASTKAVYYWPENPLFEIGCGGLENIQYINIEEGNGSSYYLIYARKRKILRAVRMSYRADGPTSHEEVEWVR